MTEKKQAALVLKHLTFEEGNQLIQQGKNPAEYSVLECLCVNVGPVPMAAMVEYEGKQIRTMAFQATFPVPMDPKVFERSVMLTQDQIANMAFAQSIPTAPVVRCIIKNDVMVEEVTPLQPVEATDDVLIEGKIELDLLNYNRTTEDE